MRERFFIPSPAATDKTKTIESGSKFAVYVDADGTEMLWSADFPIPAIGAKIWIRLNNIGWAVVKGYFESCGYVGVMSLPLDPPAWLKKQLADEKGDLAPWMREGIGCEFGSEISLDRPEDPKPIAIARAAR